MSKQKQIKQRNYATYNMIVRSQKAGLHTDLKKEANKMACRDPIGLEDWDEDGSAASLNLLREAVDDTNE